MIEGKPKGATAEEKSGSGMWKYRLGAIGILLLSVAVGWFVYASQPQLAGENSLSRFSFQLGLDLSGGTHLLYRADTSSIPPEEVEESMAALRDVIERRVNLFGVSEPIVQTETSGLLSGQQEDRLIVELPGVTNIEEATALIGATPVLEFKVERPGGETFEILQAQENGQRLDEDPYVDTPLTGRYLKDASLQFGSGQGGVSDPYVLINFTGEGADIFEELTNENVGRTIAIYLDGEPISTPVVQQAIPGGQAQITGNFTPDEAKQLAGRLSAGALPVPIELISTQSIGPSLGKEVLNAGVFAGLIGLAAVSIFMILWYRLPGILSVIALSLYLLLMLAIFKLIPVTLTAPGIAGFILSVGMAVDANILIFERTKEEIRGGKKIRDAVALGFERAWLSIRDANISSIITAIILFWFGTSLVQGFALTFGLGVLVSMISAITVTRTFLYAVSPEEGTGKATALFDAGIGKGGTTKENV